MVRVLKNVAVAVCHDVGPFELGVACEVFGLDRTDDGLPLFDFAVCAAESAPIRTNGGYMVQTEHGLERLAQADLVIVPSWRTREHNPPPALLQALRDTVARGGRVMSFCSGAFVLAAAGLLDGKRATTHWRYAREFAARFPRVQVDPNVLYVDAGAVLTSAGTSAGIDLCLHVVRQQFGAAAVNIIARRMVVPPHRDGGQAQYLETPVPSVDEEDHMGRVLAWIQEHLSEPITVASLARMAHVSPRTFARQFKTTTGTTPHHWVLGQRIQLAQRLLEEGDLSVEEVARRCGFGTAASLRQHFRQRRGTAPLAYRKTFSLRTAPAAPAGPEMALEKSLPFRTRVLGAVGAAGVPKPIWVQNRAPV